MIPTPIFELGILIISIIWLNLLLSQLGFYDDNDKPKS
jgi:hypothetical protein